MEQKRELFASIDTWDNGKPLSKALESHLTEIGKPYHVALEEDLTEAVTTIRYYSGWADKVAGQTSSTTANKFAYTIRQPIGVVGQIIPWNYPLSMATWKPGPALAAGNTVVLKPPSTAPLCLRS
jgi:aldehyde dehydrogenase (NAD(P)+)